MRLYKYLLPIVLALGCASAAHAAISSGRQDGSRFEEELNERDWEALRDFVNSKRTIDVKEKSINMNIAGDVRVEYRHLNESLNHKQLRGSQRNTLGRPGARPDDIQQFNEETMENPTLIKQYGAPLPISQNDFDMEFNLYFDYTADRTWVVAQLQFDNSAGVDSEEDKPMIDPEGWFGSGRCNDICLKKAYFGYNLFSCDATKFDIEVGRRRLYNCFDSKVQFLSRFDGILLKYASKLECISDVYAQIAGFVVDERVNQFAWAAEIGFKNIWDAGVDFKYSFIDWQKYGHNRAYFDGSLLTAKASDWYQPVQHPNAFKFMVSQWTLCYNFDPEMLNVSAKIYGAFLMNHAQKKYPFPSRFTATGDRIKSLKKPIKANLAWYGGFTLGEVIEEGDWAFDFQYQVVQAVAVPDNDCSGISTGNVLDNSITARFSRGNVNYTGYRAEALYAITDNLSIDAIVEWSREYNRHIGSYTYIVDGVEYKGSGRHRYSKVELEAIYAF